MSRLIDLTNKRFGAWTALCFGGANSLKQTVWHCVCDCGVERQVVAQTLRDGKTKSCGCQKPMLISKALTPQMPTKRSGETKHWSPEYRAYMSMHARCRKTNTRVKALYYDRGVYVCERWHDFQNFLADMGTVPHVGYSLDRIDNNGIYEPENCRWADCATQSQNRRPREEWKT